jgi:transcriptional regulator with XRE-family HTH domain
METSCNMKIETIRELRREALSRDHARAAGEAVLVRLATRLYALRVSMGLTQKELGDRAGLDQANISDIENGDANPTVRTLGRVAAGLNVDASALLEHAPFGVRFGAAVSLHEGVKWQGPMFTTKATRVEAAGSTGWRQPRGAFAPKEFKAFRSLREKVAAK